MREHKLSLVLESAQIGIGEWDLRANRLVWNARELAGQMTVI